MSAVSFLGWDGAFLPRVADWLVARFGGNSGATAAAGWDMGRVVVALPGRRAGRRLEELLVHRCEEAGGAGSFVPPEITTAGRLTDRLLSLERAAAGGLVRSLAWVHVLRQCNASKLAPLLVRPSGTGEGAFQEWWLHGDQLRALHAALGGEGLGFQEVLSELGRSGPASEQGRWKVLVELQAAYGAQLDALGLDDPHLSRRDAIAQGRVRQDVDVVLAGVTDLSGLLRATLAQLGQPVHSLVFAPQELSDHFDDWGCVRSDAWANYEMPLHRARWQVASHPAGQAAAAADTLAGWAAQRSAAEITLGVADGEVVPFLERQLASRGVPTRRAAGPALASSPVLSLLRAVSRELAIGDFECSAALVRHPDLEACLARGDEAMAHEAVASCDAFAPEHLPRRRRLSVELKRSAEAREVAQMAALHLALDDVLGELAAERRTLNAWAPVIASFLQRVYGERSWEADELEAGPAHEALLVASLELVGDSLREMQGLPGSLADELPVTAAEALDVLLASLAEETLPAPAAEEAVEMLGWLDVPHDDAPALVLTGFNEGRVPSAVRGHAFLPNGLRTRLGMADDAHRFARDAHALASILHSGRDVCLLSGRADARGDPLQPSRLAFLGSDEEVLLRAKACLPGGEGTAESARPTRSQAPAKRQLPMGPAPDTDQNPLPALSVTAFRDYLASPYLFYLRRLARVESVEAQEREMNPLVFGNVAHDVLERFGRSKLRHSQDEQKLDEALQGFLDQELLSRFGAQPLPAVVIQGRRLAHRLRTFARWQSAWRAKGWRIQQVEWQPASDQAVSLVVDDTPLLLRGRIDRIDRHERTGEWAVIDYKTSEKGDKPRRTHGPDKQGLWKDLQLPLYRLLVQPLLDETRRLDAGADAGAGAGEDASESHSEDVVRLGYVPLGKSPKDTRFLEGEWTSDELADAVECARNVVRSVREGALQELGRFPDHDRVFMAIAGRGLLSEHSEGDEEDGEAEAWGASP